jgi:TldD protein
VLERLLDAIKSSRADYADIRVERSSITSVAWRGRRLEGASTGTDVGGTVRCLNHGHGWGIASFNRLDDLEARLARAHELSLAVRPPEPVELAPAPVRAGHVLPALTDDFREIPLLEKRRYLEHLNAEMLRFDRRIVDTQAAYRDEITECWFVNSEGTALHELRPDATLSALAVARDGGVMERAVESLGARGGWTRMRDQEDLFRAAARRAVGLLDARPVRSGSYPLVLDPRLAAVVAHQTVAHLCEADTQLEDPVAAELAAPGRKLGSELLTIGDDGSVVGLRGTLPFDDEGTPPSNTLLVQHGVVVGRLHSRETAARFGERPTGNARALSFRHVPLVRLTNTYVANGSGTFADLIRDVKLGVYACDAVGSRHRGDSYSFTAGHGYMIRDGALAEPVKGVVLVGFITELLGAVDRVAGDFRWHESGGGCGKGGQSPLPVAEGAPHVRLRSAEVRGQAP